jgi:hypothetical protein
MNIHVYEYDGGSMPGTVNGYWEIYYGEYGEDFILSCDNDNVFLVAKSLADTMATDIVVHTLSKWDRENV